MPSLERKLLRESLIARSAVIVDNTGIMNFSIMRLYNIILFIPLDKLTMIKPDVVGFSFFSISKK